MRDGDDLINDTFDVLCRALLALYHVEVNFKGFAAFIVVFDVIEIWNKENVNVEQISFHFWLCRIEVAWRDNKIMGAGATVAFEVSGTVRHTSCNLGRFKLLKRIV